MRCLLWGFWRNMMTSSNGNIFRVTGHLCREFTGCRWIPRTKASDAELWCFLWSAPEWRLSKQSWGWWFETPRTHYDVTVMTWPRYNTALYFCSHEFTTLRIQCPCLFSRPETTTIITTTRFVNKITSNLLYKAHQIPNLKCFSSRLAAVFVQSIEARC